MTKTFQRVLVLALCSFVLVAPTRAQEASEVVLHLRSRNRETGLDEMICTQVRMVRGVADATCHGWEVSLHLQPGATVSTNRLEMAIATAVADATIIRSELDLSGSFEVQLAGPHDTESDQKFVDELRRVHGVRSARQTGPGRFLVAMCPQSHFGVRRFTEIWAQTVGYTGDLDVEDLVPEVVFHGPPQSS